MKVFVSQPMKGLTDQEVVAVREKIFGDFKADHPNAELLDSYGAIKKKMGEYFTYVNPSVAMLGESIQTLADADVVLFAKGWENYPGCRIEEKVATYYDINRVYVR